MHRKHPFYKIKKGIEITLNLSKKRPKVIKKFANAAKFTIIVKKNLVANNCKT